MDLSGRIRFGLVLLIFTTINNECRGASVEVDPHEVLVLPGENVTAICKVSVPLQYCRVEIPTIGALNLNHKLSYPEVEYYGSGLSAGHCGFSIKRVSDKMNGAIKCSLGIETEAQESVGQVQLIVARAPKEPEMDLSRGTDSLRVYKLHDLLDASCIVKDGRPVANISWYIDDIPLPITEQKMPTVIDLAKENLQSKLQNISRILQAGDNGRHLRCVAYHPAYPNGRSETRRQLDVKYGPLPQNELDKFGYTIGQPGVISLVVESNPKPIIAWQVSGNTIREGQNDQTGRITAESVRELGIGRYEANLRLAAINKHDTDEAFVLRAYNDMGSQDYIIKISTSPEPEGVELGIGGIIGIVIALMVIVLAAFLLVFAKLTSRWCFSGDHELRTIGESSDTESAEVRKESKHFSPIQLTSFFKKSKKGDAPEPETTTPAAEEEEEKKAPLAEGENAPGLVYAELDLVNPNPSKVKPVIKSDDEKTEYAEIVYTQPEKEPAEQLNTKVAKK